ncbi:TBC1 domain family member 23 isoform X1 [Penaeus vannamei]|uniref:TBC1 domain family member 23 isoform X1 n=1 Tax=Penaeus vannamei TaxID=6689 RepID=UPI000F65B1F0|nr:TBC1 domain family member 23-like isoform X1 [Penaeus vannamei]
MSLDDEDSTWLLALESALHEGADDHELIGITRGRILPEEHRAEIWYICLGGGNKFSNFAQFDEIFDLQDQSVVRADVKSLVDKLGNEEEDKVSIVCDVESIFTHYCKTRHLKYDTSQLWGDIVLPLLAAKMPRDHIYVCFEEILEKYIPRESGLGGSVYHLLRLILLYHDPELSTFLDSRKITPDLYATSWMRSLFSSVCSLDATMAVWDIYFQERDPFFILFLALVILVNARDQVLEMKSETRDQIITMLSGIPGGLSVDDVSDFCSLARYYIIKTPHTFRKDFTTAIFGSVYMGHGEVCNRVGDLPLSQALCLPVSAEEIIDTCDMLQVAGDDIEQVRFFLVDCRPSDQYNAGHLPNAFHLDSSLMLQHPASFQTAVQGLFMAQRQAVASETPGCGQHLCFIGSGREQEDQYVHMVVASFLQRNSQYVSLAKGGYHAIHDLLVHNISESLADHDSKRCLVCAPDSQSHSSEPADQEDFTITTKPQPSLMNKFSSLSSVFKMRSPPAVVEKLTSFVGKPSINSEIRGKFSGYVAKSTAVTVKLKESNTEPSNAQTFGESCPEEGPSSGQSAEMKEKLVEYITNPNGDGTTVDRHVSAQDRGKLYRNQGDVFSIEDDDGDGGGGADGRENDRLEVVKVSQWLKKPDVITSFACHQVKENGYMYKCHLLLTDTLLFVIRESETKSGEGHVTARRTLASIVKITSKKRHPDLITFKYGTTSPDGEVTVSDMDRFLIPKASEATKIIKEQIMKQMDAAKS